MIIFFRVLLIVIGGIIAVITLLTTIGEIWYERRVQKELDQLFSSAPKKAMNKVRMDTLEQLPAAIQRFLIYVQILNKPIPSVIRVEQEGNFRSAESAPWMTFNATQHFTIDPPGFIWKAKMKMAPFITLSVRDKFFQGKGSMQANLFSLIPMVNEENAAIDQGALVRYLGEMVWFPYSFLSPHITWKSLGEYAAQATLNVGELSVTGTFYVNEGGEITHFEADRMRSDVEGESWGLYKNSYKNYHLMGACRIPTVGEAGWERDSGYFSYVNLKIKGVREER